MAVPRDPAFWKRFSTAVHMDEEAAQSPDFKQIHQYVPPLPFPSLLHTHTSHIHSSSFQIDSLTYFFFSLFRDSWLARQQRKSSRRTWVCYGFWISFMIIVAAVVIVIIWLLNNGYFAAGDSSSNGSDAGN